MKCIDYQGKGGSVRLRVGRFSYDISIRVPELDATFRRLYADYPLVERDEPIDFNVSLDLYHSLRRPFRRWAVFACDGVARFGPFPRREAMPYLEWGLNSCVARWSPYHLMLHAGTVAHAGRGMILAGASGSGKSTLAAALMQRGWQLLSDEFALIRLSDGQLDPWVRPVCVKNEMIPRMKAAFPDAVFGPSSPGERKGMVAHMKLPAEAVARMDEPVLPARMIFVQYESGASTKIASLGKAEAMKRAVAHCFNYKRLGRQGFDLLADTIDRCDCHTLTFGDAFDAAQFLEKEFNHG
jgi:HprK-related kinase A